MSNDKINGFERSPYQSMKVEHPSMLEVPLIEPNHSLPEIDPYCEVESGTREISIFKIQKGPHDPKEAECYIRPGETCNNCRICIRYGF